MILSCFGRENVEERILYCFSLKSMGISVEREVGTVICTSSGPSAFEFDFVITNTSLSVPIRTGQFVEVNTEEGTLIAQVTEIMKTNRYFMHAEAVREYERSGKPLTRIFPVDKWEYIIAKAKPLAISINGRLERVTFPPSPGEKVKLASQDTLANFLGLDIENGIELGTVRYHNIPARLNLTRLLQKHVAILAISGAGKSYLASILTEELLLRSPAKGRVAVVIIDVHGEYASLAEKVEGSEYVDFSDKVSVFKTSFFQIAVPQISERMFGEFQPQISPIQIRELGRILKNLKRRMYETGVPYSLQDVIREIEQDEKMNIRTKEALLGWLYDLEETGLFGPVESPNLDKIVKPGHAAIIDLSEIISLRKKQILISYVARRLFDLRKQDKIPPFVLILEEAHQFCPEARRELAISKSIIETIAREGRKFFASLCLISQRPVKLSTTVLSQCNTHIILRITNPYDLKHIGESSEGIDRNVLDVITTLNVGEALVVGEAVNFPLFIKIRKRKSKEPKHALNLEDAAKKFEKSYLNT